MCKDCPKQLDPFQVAQLRLQALSVVAQFSAARLVSSLVNQLGLPPSTIDDGHSLTVADALIKEWALTDLHDDGEA